MDALNGWNVWNGHKYATKGKNRVEVKRRKESKKRKKITVSRLNKQYLERQRTLTKMKIGLASYAIRL